MSKKPYCDEELSLKIPLSGLGYSDGILCDLLRGHKSRVHQASYSGRSHTAGNPTAREKSVTATIKWTENAAE